MDYRNTYYWTFDIESDRIFDRYNPYYLDFITDENKAAWQRFIHTKIRELMKPETMESQEFKTCLEEVRKEKEQRIARELWNEQQRIKAADDRQRRRSMERPKITYIPKGLTIDYVEEYGKFLKQEVEFVPTCQEDFLYQRRLIERWYKKSVPQLIAIGRPDAAYGVSMALCKAIPQFIFREDIKTMLDTQRRQLRKLIIGAFEGLVESVKAWNNENERKKVCEYISSESQRYKDWKGMSKTLNMMIPSTAFTGEPLAVSREMSDSEIYQERLRKQEEARRLEAEKEARSIIPLNKDYENRIFNHSNIDWDCNTIWFLMLDENKNIEKQIAQGDYKGAALKFMQMTKSMCRHFVEDEHYDYFDDMYSPEYAVDDMLRTFKKLDDEHKLPKEVKDYLLQAWKDIKDTECYRDYGIPSKDFENIIVF